MPSHQAVCPHTAGRQVAVAQPGSGRSDPLLRFSVLDGRATSDRSANGGIPAASPLRIYRPYRFRVDISIGRDSVAQQP
jgi:hypothetical protein